MARIEITSRDAQKLARSFADLIGPRGLTAIRRRAVNADRRRGEEEDPLARWRHVFGTSASALSVQGKAASPGSTDPAYRLRFAAKIPIAKLKAAHRKVRRSRGRASLVIDTPNDDAIRFRSIRREGSRFVLLRAGPLPERSVGGVFTNRGNGIRALPRAEDLEEEGRKGPARGGCDRDQRPPEKEAKMSQIGDTENALLGLLRNCQLPSGVHIGSAPSQSGMPGSCNGCSHPPRRSCSRFLGAQPHADPGSSTSLNLVATWGAYCRGSDGEERHRKIAGLRWTAAMTSFPG